MAKVQNAPNEIWYSTQNMGTYKSRIIKHKTKGSQTPGSTKGPSCQSSQLQRAMARNSKAYKHPLYGRFCKYWDGLNNSRMSAPSAR